MLGLDAVVLLLSFAVFTRKGRRLVRHPCREHGCIAIVEQTVQGT